jgi:hypothetical protein
MLLIVHEVLRRRYGHIEFLGGQGVSKGQRVSFDDSGQRVRCVIKTSNGGRISFKRRDDGSWSGLSDTDRVVIVGPTTLHGEDQLVRMFDQKVLLDAFEANHIAQEKAGMGHLPSWLAPFHEDYRTRRGVGDGFGEKAIWIEPLNGTSPASGLKAVTTSEESARALTIAEAKLGLAKTFGVDVDAVEITIRG